MRVGVNLADSEVQLVLQQRGCLSWPFITQILCCSPTSPPSATFFPSPPLLRTDPAAAAHGPGKRIRVFRCVLWRLRLHAGATIRVCREEPESAIHGRGRRLRGLVEQASLDARPGQADSEAALVEAPPHPQVLSCLLTRLDPADFCNLYSWPPGHTQGRKTTRRTWSVCSAGRTRARAGVCLRKGTAGEE